MHVAANGGGKGCLFVAVAAVVAGVRHIVGYIQEKVCTRSYRVVLIMYYYYYYSCFCDGDGGGGGGQNRKSIQSDASMTATAPLLALRRRMRAVAERQRRPTPGVRSKGDQSVGQTWRNTRRENKEGEHKRIETPLAGGIDKPWLEPHGSISRGFCSCC